MRIFLEKTILMIHCLLMISSSLNLVSQFSTIIIIYSLVLSIDILKKEYHLIILIILAIILLLSKDGIIFIPLFIYCSNQLNYYIGMIGFLFIIYPLNLSLLFIGIIAYYLAFRTQEYQANKLKNTAIYHSLKSNNLYLQQEHLNVRNEQIKNIEIATLQERNRIAHQLHDSIGHTISSSILQLEALQLMTKENLVQKRLSHLSKRMQEGMNDIRHTLHLLYDDSFDLELKLNQVMQNLHHSKFNFNYSINSQLDIYLKNDILSIVQELITNHNKHSNSDIIKINVIEQPSFFTITYHDNGQFDQNDFNGIGLLSMQETARKYNGTMTVDNKNGFYVHIILMKEEF